jgi:succinylglutamate desuccinylase
VELLALLDLIAHEIMVSKAKHVVLLDLHTTSASGGIFSVATDHPESVRIAVELHAPVITGMLRGIRGTTLHFFNAENLPLLYPDGDVPSVQITSVAFEAGQHHDPLSVNRTIAAIINCMRTIGSVRTEDVENRHDDLLIAYSKDLPKITELVKVHAIAPADEFRMRPGYRNFQPVVQHEVLAEDRRGAIRSPEDGLILMPLYQPQGSEGFFLVRKIA